MNQGFSHDSEVMFYMQFKGVLREFRGFGTSSMVVNEVPIIAYTWMYIYVYIEREGERERERERE